MSLSLLCAQKTTSDVLLGRHHEDMADLDHYVSVDSLLITVSFGSQMYLLYNIDNFSIGYGGLQSMSRVLVPLLLIVDTNS